MFFSKSNNSTTSDKFLVIAIALLLLPGCAVSISEAEIFRPNQEHRREGGSSLVLDGEDQLPNSTSIHHERIDTKIGKLAVTFVNTKSDRLIVHCYGNASDRKSSGVRRIRELQPYANLLLFDYPGYGDSEGLPNAAQLEEAAQAVARYAVATGAKQIIAWGQSMGGFVCARVAHHLDERLTAVVFETTAQNAEAVAQSWKPWYAGPFVRINISDGLGSFDNVEALASFRGHVLVLGAGEDQVLDVSLSRELTRNLIDAGINTQFQEFDDATHMNVPQQPDFESVVAAFLKEATESQN